ncbi:hypothetical protein [Streptomyces sp. NPDC059063]|uniref:hypothetical protein n=1 Tax=unclassified Streptomyces TaxID=2593676 RepID=UPI00367ADA19
MRVKWRARWGAAVVIALALAGCGSGSSDDGAAPVPGAPVVKAERDLPRLPLGRYEFSTRDYDRQEAATRRATQKCMHAYGFADFPSQWRERDTTLADTEVLTVSSTTLYGTLDLAGARRLGYGAEPDALAEFSRKHEKGRPVTPGEYEVLHGVRETGNGEASVEGGFKVNGRAVPEGGCVQRGERQLRPRVKDELRMTAYVAERRAALDKAVAKDGRIRRALDAWADCVADKGFKRYASPAAALGDKAWGRDGRGRTKGTRRERDTAVADIECKRTHNTAGVWWAVAAEKQRRDIARHKSAYEAVRADQDRVRATVRRALGEES